MVRLRISELLKQQGKTKYWAYKQLGMSSQNFDKLAKNQTRSIRFETLDALCTIFNCEVADLFERDGETPSTGKK